MEIVKVEVEGLEAAVCGLVHLLDLLITDDRGVRLLYPGEGVHIYLPETLPKNEFVDVLIRPVRWKKKSFIEARFVRTIDGWRLCSQGRIVAPHLKGVCDGINFYPVSSGLGVKLDTDDTIKRSLIVEGYHRLVVWLSGVRYELKSKD